MTRCTPLIALAAVLMGTAVPAAAQTARAVAGEKLDSGLGSLAHYSQWSTPSAGKAASLRVEGESLDSLLGELPHYRLWVDRSGKDPMGHLAAVIRYTSARSAAAAPSTLNARVAQAPN
jgi:maltooligosyltrehalose synthase